MNNYSAVLSFFHIELDTFIIIVSVIAVILMITLFFLLLDYLKIRKRYMQFMTGETGKNLEYTIYKRFREIDELKTGQKDNDDQIEIIYDMVRRSYNKIGICHYNAFAHSISENGGSISFALVLLNSSDDGFIFNVIHNRAGCYVYLKEIKKGLCEIALSEEEKIALDKAINYGKKPESGMDDISVNHENTEPVKEDSTDSTE